MRNRKRSHQHNLLFAILGIVAFASWMVLAGGPSSGSRALTGPRLVAIQPLPEMARSGPMCQTQPASASAALLAALMQAPAAQAAGDSDQRNLIRDREPLRVIKDPYPTYSAVAVDTTNNELVLQDENLFQIMAYDRMTNTPPTAAMSEPKRVIGGHQTNMEFNCALYIDPVNGDIYSVNNDTLNTLTIFSREVRGDMPPTRQLETPHGTYGIAVDEGAKEMFLTVQHASSIVVYNKYAQGEDKPLRTLVGNKTGLADPHGIALDTKSGLIFVANYGNYAAYSEGRENSGEGGTGGEGRVLGSGKFFPPSITIYPIKATGDVAPLRTIAGPKTQLNWPAHMYVDEDTGLLYIANDGGDSVLVFKVTDGGDVAPTRALKGPRSGIKNPTGVSIDKKHNELIVANMGNHQATVYPLNATGDVPPSRVIRAAPPDQPALQIGNPGAVAYDTKRNEILVPN